MFKIIKLNPEIGLRNDHPEKKRLHEIFKVEADRTEYLSKITEKVEDDFYHN